MSSKRGAQQTKEEENSNNVKEMRKFTHSIATKKMATAIIPKVWKCLGPPDGIGFKESYGDSIRDFIRDNFKIDVRMSNAAPGKSKLTTYIICTNLECQRKYKLEFPFQFIQNILINEPTDGFEDQFEVVVKSDTNTSFCSHGNNRMNNFLYPVINLYFVTSRINCKFRH